MNIKIKTLSGKIIKINIDNDYTINKIKQLIQEMEGIDSDQLKILHNGLILENESKIKDHQINQHSILHLILALRSGYCIL